MTFEFDYNTDTDRITIVYDGSCVVTADYDGERVIFHHFDKIDDENVEKILKNLCKDFFNAIA